ncbi:MAG: DMT family transporter [Myxococcota bacterium]
MPAIPFLGELCAMLAPMCWSVAVILYRKTELPPAAMNLFKNSLAALLLTVTMLAFGIEVSGERSAADWAMLVGSGLLGLALADTLLFEGLRRIGAARLALVDTTYAPMMVVMAWAFLGERPGAGFLAGAAAVVMGNAVANVDLRAASGPRDREFALGLAMAFFAVVGSGASVIVIKPILETSDLVEVTWIRLVAGIGGQLLWLAVRRDGSTIAKAFRPTAEWRTLLPGAVLGTYVALLLWLGGFKWAEASVAAVLNQLATIYIIVLAWAFLGETVSRRQLIGASLAVTGAIVVLVS